MATNVTASILICTRNRAAFLQQTLSALAAVDVPAGMKVETVVIDNASDDDTRAVVENHPFTASMPLRYELEPRKGLDNARNRGLAATKGDLFFFLDDDVRPPQDWLQRMSAPLVAGVAQGVAGGVRLPPSHIEPWMTRDHRFRLMDTGVCYEGTDYVIGANMGFARKVLDKVPAFDPEIDAGTLYLGGDTLFSNQVREADFRIVTDYSIEVEHHYDKKRLNREVWLFDNTQRANYAAYETYHWYHQNISLLSLRLLKIRLWLLINKRRFYDDGSGTCQAELRALWRQRFLLTYREERKKPRKYSKRGLVKMER